MSLNTAHRLDGHPASSTVVHNAREWVAAHTVVDGPRGFSGRVPGVGESRRAEYALLRWPGRNAAAAIFQWLTGASDRLNRDAAFPPVC